MRAAEVLVIVGDTEGVLVVNEAIDLSKANVLVKTARERTSCRLNLSGQAGIVDKEIRRETIYGGGAVFRVKAFSWLSLCNFHISTRLLVLSVPPPCAQ